MFCLECGTEMALRERVCPVCGHVYGDRERAFAESPNSAASKRPGSRAPDAGGTLASAATSVRHVGDPSAAGMPGDLPGRFVLAVSLGLAADLVLPWVSINGSNFTPASVGAPVVVVVALLAAGMLPVFTTSLRTHPIWSALPLMVGALCAGIAATVWLLLAPVAQIFATAFGSDPSNLVLSPQVGLYLFVLGAAALLVSGQQMLAAEHQRQLSEARRDALRVLQAKQPNTVRAVPQVPFASATAVQSSTAVASASHTANGASEPPQAQSPAAALATDAASPTPTTPVAPILPGSAAWNQAPAAPSPQRPAPGSGWGKSHGSPRLR